ncbi:MAG: LysM peptidoglycan-binding domain-containing protein [Chloroflexota bacterium]
MKARLLRPLAVTAALLMVAPTLPALADSTYMVRAGDTLWSIAHANNLTVSELAAANGIDNPNLIFVDEELTIPGGTGSAPAQSAPAAPSAPATAPARSVPRTSGSPGSVLDKKVIVSYYGNPYTGIMGVLGQLSKEELVLALKRRAAQYEAASGRPTQAAIHFVATVAQASAGADGMYRAGMPMDLIEEYAQLAADNDMLFIIDVQFGRSTVQAEIQRYLELLRRPYVHLAMDPEFDMWGSELPGIDLGHMTAQEINYAQQVLSTIVAENGIPNKILMVYQFTASMLPDVGAVASDPRVDVVVNMDGFGGRGIKLQHYDWYVAEAPVEYAGIKLFLEHDIDLMSAAEVMAIQPPPNFVVYQ